MMNHCSKCCGVVDEMYSQHTDCRNNTLAHVRRTSEIRSVKALHHMQVYTVLVFDDASTMPAGVAFQRDCISSRWLLNNNRQAKHVDRVVRRHVVVYA